MPVSVDELASLLRAPVDQLANALLSLELMELIFMLPGQRYARTNG
jgi:predicted Rossmann fold nucleotide-binding protein DprA/Smf involved in DNA uptake